MADISQDVIIVTSSLTKDMTGKVGLDQLHTVCVLFCGCVGLGVVMCVLRVHMRLELADKVVAD